MSQDSAVVKSKNFRNNTKMLTARIPLGMVRKFEAMFASDPGSCFLWLAAPHGAVTGWKSCPSPEDGLEPEGQGPGA